MHSDCAPAVPATQPFSGGCQRTEFARGSRQKEKDETREHRRWLQESPGEEGESRAVTVEAPSASAHLSVACPAAPQELGVPLCSAPQDGVGVREALPGLLDPALLPTGTQVSLTREEEALLHPLPNRRIGNNSGSLAST